MIKVSWNGVWLFFVAHGMPFGDSPCSNNKVEEADCDNTSYLERFKASHLQQRQRIVRGRIWSRLDLAILLFDGGRERLIRQLYFCSRRGNKENLTTWLIKEKNEPFEVGWLYEPECVWVIRLPGVGRTDAGPRSGTFTVQYFAHQEHSTAVRGENRVVWAHCKQLTQWKRTNPAMIYLPKCLFNARDVACNWNSRYKQTETECL